MLRSRRRRASRQLGSEQAIDVHAEQEDRSGAAFADSVRCGRSGTPSNGKGLRASIQVMVSARSALSTARDPLGHVRGLCEHPQGCHRPQWRWGGERQAGEDHPTPAPKSGSCDRSGPDIARGCHCRAPAVLVQADFARAAALSNTRARQGRAASRSRVRGLETMVRVASRRSAEQRHRRAAHPSSTATPPPRDDDASNQSRGGRPSKTITIGLIRTVDPRAQGSRSWRSTRDPTVAPPRLRHAETESGSRDASGSGLWPGAGR